MDIKEIREILGHEYDDVSDEKLLVVYYSIKKLCEYLIDYYFKEELTKKTKQKNTINTQK